MFTHVRDLSQTVSGIDRVEFLLRIDYELAGNIFVNVVETEHVCLGRLGGYFGTTGVYTACCF